MSAPGAALRTAILKTLYDDVGTAIVADKDALKESMQAAGSEKTGARLPDGTKVASLSLVGGEKSPRVSDPAAFRAWVEANHPGELETVIRDSYVKAVLEDAKKAGRALDRVTGELIPGVTFEPTTPYIRVTFTRGDTDGRELIRRAWRDKAIDLPSVLELPAGEAPDAS